MKGIFGILHLLSIPPEIVGIVKVRSGMRSVTEKVVKTLVDHERRVVGITTESGLSN